MQETDGYHQLERILHSYPVPKYLNELSKGSSLRIDLSLPEKKLKTQLDEFLDSRKMPEGSIADKSVIESIGQIPLIELFDPQLKGKVGHLWSLDVSFNPGLSIKDIIAREMMQDAMDKHILQRGKTWIVEATSGNTGAGLAMLGALYGIGVILVVPDKVSQEKIERLLSFGAHVIIAPTGVSPTDPHSYYSIRDYLGKKENVWVPQQYDNPSNTLAHRTHTGPRIWEETKGSVTAVIIPTGTSGTISGIGQYLKKKNPKIKIIGVDTIGSILYLLQKGYEANEVQKYAHSYDIQGFGEDFKPKNFDASVIDYYIRVSDISGLQMTQLLLPLGVVQGQSSGASYAALLESIETGIITNRDNVVVIFPDVGIPYRHDVYNDDWMNEKKFSITN